MGPSSRRDILGALALGAGALAASSAAAEELSPSRSPGIGGTDPGPKDPARAGAKSRHPQSARHRPRHAAQSALLLRRLACPAIQRRLDAAGDGARARDLEADRRRQHAPQRRRDSRAALAQGSRVGLHALRLGPHHRHRRRRAAISSTTSASAISGIFPRAFRTRSRVSDRTAANSCSPSTAAASTRTAPSC